MRPALVAALVVFALMLACSSGEKDGPAASPEEPAPAPETTSSAGSAEATSVPAAKSCPVEPGRQPVFHEADEFKGTAKWRSVMHVGEHEGGATVELERVDDGAGVSTYTLLVSGSSEVVFLVNEDRFAPAAKGEATYAVERGDLTRLATSCNLRLRTYGERELTFEHAQLEPLRRELTRFLERTSDGASPDEIDACWEGCTIGDMPECNARCGPASFAVMMAARLESLAKVEKEAEKTGVGHFGAFGSTPTKAEDGAELAAKCQEEGVRLEVKPSGKAKTTGRGLDAKTIGKFLDAQVPRLVNCAAAAVADCQALAALDGTKTSVHLIVSASSDGIAFGRDTTKPSGVLALDRCIKNSGRDFRFPLPKNDGAMTIEQTIVFSRAK